jgi:hypothetical protein
VIFEKERIFQNLLAHPIKQHIGKNDFVDILVSKSRGGWVDVFFDILK